MTSSTSDLVLAKLDPLERHLIPDPKDMFDGCRSVEDFCAIGEGYLRGYIAPHGRLRADDAVLDIGSGNGKLARVLTKTLSPRGRYCGFDIVKSGIDWCKERYADFPNFSFAHADLKSDFYNKNGAIGGEDFVFPYENSSFDLAFAGSLFTHIAPNITNNYLRQTARVLKPGGRLVMTCALVNEHNLGIPSSTAIRQREYQRASAFHHVLDSRNPSKGVAYDESAMRRMISDTGMIVSTILFGTWANGEAVVPGFQDCMIVLRPILPKEMA